MSEKKIISIPLNRVEGDLEIRVETNDGVVSNAWSSGIMYRGFENILKGRGALDGLVLTPRICGICTTAHLTAAALALDMIAAAEPPPNAVRIRNIALMTEFIQSDMRHGFLMFAPDFTNPVYKQSPLWEEAVRRYEPLKGAMAREVLAETAKVLGIIALVGGQWPHSSYMVPGGVCSVPDAEDLIECLLLLRQYRGWYERRVLGCSLERWAEVKSAADLAAWLDECDAHRESELGFFIRFARMAGLDRIGSGRGNFLSYGAFEIPEGSSVRAPAGASSAAGCKRLIPAGFAARLRTEGFDQAGVAEHVAYSWFRDYEGGKHPMEGETRPYATGQEGDKYSWAKAPRYMDQPAETGPLAQAVISGNPLFLDLIEKEGVSVFARQLARLVRPAGLMPTMAAWIEETRGGGEFYRPPGEIVEGRGYGLTDVSRGALGHWVRIADGAIEHYQIITPTGWNLSPRDSAGARGPAEEALVGTEIGDLSSSVRLEHVVRSFDACLVCTVHTVRP